MRYEILYIIPAKFTENEIEPIINNVVRLIEKVSGKIVKNENLGRKKLAYPIKGFRQGYYILNEMDLETSALKELNKELGLTLEIIRYQIVKAEERKITKKPRPAAVRKPIEEVERLGAETELEEINLDKIEEPKITQTPKIKPSEEKKKLSMDDLDKKLDEILDMSGD